ncbi:MAG: hypothetical protein ACI4JA_02990 [Oscillospiraceae bacterium]
MKKISALLLALIMTCAAFTACGDSDSDSKKKTEKKSETSSAAAVDDESKADESKAEESKEDDSKVEEGGLAKAYTEKLNSGEFAFDMTVSSDMTGEIPCSMAAKNGNFHVTMAMMGMNIEIYIVDGKAYTLMPEAKLYEVSEDIDLDEMGLDTFTLDEDYKYVETKEEDGMTVEVYTVPSEGFDISGLESEEESSESDESSNDTVSYYFDADGNLKKIVTVSSLAGTTTVTVNSLAFECDDIVLPDLSDWVESKEGEELDPETQMKVTLSMFGVTEEMVKDAGFTYAQLAELEDEELMEALSEMGVDLSGLMGDFE